MPETDSDESTASLPDTVEVPIQRASSSGSDTGHYNVSLDQDFAEVHGLFHEGAVAYSYELLEGGELALRGEVVDPSEREDRDVRPSNERSVTRFEGSRAVIRLPTFVLRERGLSELLGRENDSGVVANIESLDRGVIRISTTPPMEVPAVGEMELQTETAIKRLVPVDDGKDMAYTAYRLIPPKDWGSEIYGLGVSDPVAFRLVQHDGALGVELRFDVTERDTSRPEVSKLLPHSTTDQYRVTFPRFMALALSWPSTSLELFPDDDRIVVLPEE
jgi:hypothetical protein